MMVLLLLTYVQVACAGLKLEAEYPYHLEKKGVNEEYMMHICHAGDVKAAEAVMAQAKEKFPKVEMEMMFLSPSMITHGGPGCVTIQVIKK